MGIHVTDYGLEDPYTLRIYQNGKIEVLSYSTNKKGKPLKPRLGRSGYVTFTLNKRSVTLHSIVCSVVHGPRPEGYQINHKDGNKLNNHPSNLEYCTAKDNVKHAFDMGLLARRKINVYTQSELRGAYSRAKKGIAAQEDWNLIKISRK